MTSQRIFFLTTIPGLESVSHLELCEKWGQAAAFFNLQPYPDVQFFKGGFEFKAPLPLGLLLNKYMRTSTRILLREPVFFAANEKEFVAGLKKIAWQDYFPAGSEFDFKFTSKSSKISMKHQVQKVMESVLKSKKIKYKSGAPAIFIRLFRDQCNISFDCTGEPGYKRGGNQKGSIASLRESTAAAVLRILLQGVQGPFVLIDPMCGSGTFLNESLLVNSKHKREFAFEKFPVLKKIENEMLEVSEKMVMNHILPEKAYGFDFNEKAVRLAETNAESFDLQDIQVEQSDLFDKKQGLIDNSRLKKIVIINPPWGKRLPGVTQDILKAAYKKYQPDRIGLLMPARWKMSEIPLEKVRDRPILNSGVENRFVVFA